MSNISPRVDIAFKKIFGVEENKDLLISLINSIVGEEDQVSEVTLLNPYNVKNFKDDKLSILDIKARSVTDNKLFNIEIQVSNESDYEKRALYYWSRLYSDQLKSGQDYSKLSKTIGIHILNFTSVSGTEDYHNIFDVRDRKYGISLFADFELHTIELNKFSSGDEKLADIVEKIKTSLDVWTAFLTRHDLLKSDNLPKELNNDDLKKAITVLEVMNLNDEERDSYEDHLKWMRMEFSAIKKATEDAEARGEARGEVIGKAEGREERNIEIAKNLLIQKVDINTIAVATGLSVAKIEELKLYTITSIF